jgi:hypothetical protein
LHYHNLGTGRQRVIEGPQGWRFSFPNRCENFANVSAHELDLNRGKNLSL